MIQYLKYALAVPAVLWVVFLSSCARPQEKYLREMERMEQLLKADTTTSPDMQKADMLLKLYLEYAEKFADDTLSPSCLFKAGELAFSVGRYEEAMGCFDKVQRYPRFVKCPDALFLQGFIADGNLRNPERAKKYYSDFLERYPDHPLAHDVRIMITQLTLSPEELIRSFREAGKDSLSADTSYVTP